MGGNSTLRTPGFGQKRKKKSLILTPAFTLKVDMIGGSCAAALAI
jgi:hypothetical protein